MVFAALFHASLHIMCETKTLCMHVTVVLEVNGVYEIVLFQEVLAKASNIFSSSLY